MAAGGRGAAAGPAATESAAVSGLWEAAAALARGAAATAAQESPAGLRLKPTTVVGQAMPEEAGLRVAAT